MSSNAIHPAQLALLNSQAQLPTLARVAVTVAVMATKWDMNWRTRKALGRLDPYELDDIGLTSAEAKREANKRFYQR
ncbi:DUF1127 domain-containing protein [Loktanella sp. F6476L]|uniref:DUF1127 domain-containing protein n=1 Tax=Loktanella sp. F6476L TaxID=2926405 RepID=UPI001FF5FA95|nr:DUF1127 domain-containing protein [Loktanella sp. F6476L]MCK0121422.1 DUF1127 domain-containing protein [Loktanella sp. F6476L]UWQ98044.1 DUF1127 domain-containing protein [Rhodobacteraceae bacterium S2214]